MKKILEIFFIYFKIGAFTIGGGYAMLPLIQEEVVTKKAWLSTEEFMDMFAVIQSAPGPIAVNSAVFLGYKIAGTLGAIAGTLGAVLPSFFIILIIAIFFSDFRNFPVVDKIFKGVRPGVVGLIVAAVFKLSRSLKLNRTNILIYITSLGLIVAAGLHPILLILASAAFGVYRARQQHNSGEGS